MSNRKIDPKYLNSVCKVRSMENAMLTTGHINEITDEYVTIKCEPEMSFMLNYNKRVKLSVLNDNYGYLSLIATVYISTKNILKLYDIKEISDFEKRSYFRLNVFLKGIITLLGDEDVDEDVDTAVSHQVIVENISLSGVLFHSDFPLNLNDRLNIRIITSTGDLKFKCSVKRIVPDEIGTNVRYGCKFDKYPEKAGDALWKYMLFKEREDIRKRRGGR